jgi:hypothetical protein
MDPQKGRSRFPLVKYAALKEPFCCAVVMSATGNVVVGRRIWWGEPHPKVFSQLAPWEER